MRLELVGWPLLDDWLTRDGLKRRVDEGDSGFSKANLPLRVAMAQALLLLDGGPRTEARVARDIGGMPLARWRALHAHGPEVRSLGQRAIRTVIKSGRLTRSRMSNEGALLAGCASEVSTMNEAVLQTRVI
jgi:hypothetical protein